MREIPQVFRYCEEHHNVDDDFAKNSMPCVCCSSHSFAVIKKLDRFVGVRMP